MTCPWDKHITDFCLESVIIKPEQSDAALMKNTINFVHDIHPGFRKKTTVFIHLYAKLFFQDLNSVSEFFSKEQDSAYSQELLVMFPSKHH